MNTVISFNEASSCRMYARHVTDSCDNMKSDHYHDHYEIFYFLGKEMTYFLDNRPLKLSQYDIILVDKSVYHRTFYFPGLSQERINISFDLGDLQPINEDELIRAILSLFKKTKLSLKDRKNADDLNRLFLKLCEAFTQTGPMGKTKSRLLLCELLLSLLEMGDLFYPQDQYEDLNVIEKRISAITVYINTHFNELITLDSISREFYISKHYLCHAFKRITGMGLTAFINRKRLSEAEMLLKYSNMGMSEICEKTGFNSQGYFIELFKKQYGYSPTNYRKNCWVHED